MFQEYYITTLLRRTLGLSTWTDCKAKSIYLGTVYLNTKIAWSSVKVAIQTYTTVVVECCPAENCCVESHAWHGAGIAKVTCLSTLYVRLL